MRHDWTVAEVEALFALPFADLMFRAQDTHRANHDPNAVQTRDAAVDQDRRLPGGLRLLPAERALRHRPRTRDAGAARRSAHPCAGREGCRRDPLLHGRGVALAEEARRRSRRRDDPRSARARHGDLRHARHAEHRAGAANSRTPGLDYYNHNVDTSPEFYGEIITTRTYQDRLDTLAAVREAGLNVCCGGIVGMGETVRDRASMLATLANLPQHPESVPINQLVRVPGTPLAGQKEVDPFDFVRTIAVARIVMPKAAVRLSAGREVMSDELQALCFLAGANSIFYGEKLLTTGNPDVARDRALFDAAGYHSAGAGARRAAARTHITSTCTDRTAITASAGASDCRMQRDAAALKAALADLEQRQLKRTRRVGIAPGLVNFCSNDYLGLKDHPEVMRAFTDAASKSWRGQRRFAPGDRPWRRTRGAGSRTGATSPAAKRRWFSPPATWPTWA